MVAFGLRDLAVVRAALGMVRLARSRVPASELRAGLARLLPVETDRQWLREFMDCSVRQIRWQGALAGYAARPGGKRQWQQISKK